MIIIITLHLLHYFSSQAFVQSPTKCGDILKVEGYRQGYEAHNHGGDDEWVPGIGVGDIGYRPDCLVKIGLLGHCMNISERKDWRQLTAQKAKGK